MPAAIKHMFVLMMENRSMDHMLGFMQQPGYDLDGLDGHESNLDSTGEPVKVTPDPQSMGDLTADPHHHFPDVVEQLYGTPTPVPGQVADMSGFVKNYERVAGKLAGKHIMRSFAPAQLPVLTTLAREYAVCDRWFSSIPGPTLPNRLFAHCGTSGGRLEMAPDDWKGFYSLYEELAQHDVDSCIFYHDWSGTLTFNGLLAHQNLFYQSFDTFVQLCRGNESDVPAYCFLEPRYSPESSSTGGVHDANDQHPDNDVGLGELLVQNVYNAIRQNDDLWKSSVLVIVYDEHGGLYDHVPPVALPNPDGKKSVVPPFDFTQSGVRVPAIVVSPYVKAGTVCHTIFDHTSLISSAFNFLLNDQWPTNRFGARTQSANAIGPMLDLLLPPRMERPDFAPIPAPSPEISLQAAAAPLSDLQQQNLSHAMHLNSRLPVDSRIPLPSNGIQHALDAGDFSKQVANAAVAQRRSVR